MKAGALDLLVAQGTLDARLAEVLAGVATERSWPDGAVLVEQGEHHGDVFLLLEGRVQVERRLPDNALLTLSTQEPGTLFGSLSALDGGTRAARCIALGPVRCAILTNTDFRQLMDGRAPLALRFQAAVVQALFRDLRLTNQRLAQLARLPDADGMLEELAD